MPFAPYSLAEFVIRRSPGWVATSAIDRLGHAAKPVVGWTVVGAAMLTGIGLARRSAATKAMVAAALTVGAAALDPNHPAVVAVLVSAGVAATAVGAASVLLAIDTTTRPAGVDPVRRRLLAGAGLVVGAAWLTPAALRRSLRRVPATAVRADRPATVRADPLFAAVGGLSPLVTPTAAHYVVDIDLDPPAVAAPSWRLQVGGLVANRLSWGLDDLGAQITDERLITLSCISNPVGGPLVGNARWTGVPLAELLRQARPSAGARFVVAEAADGYRESYPLELAMGADPLVAFGMDGSLLPVAHGAPARLVVPGHYGMKSVKWLTKLAVIDADPVGYWGQRGWNEPATTRTESRIDTPRGFAHVQSPVAVAGVAWAGDRRIAGVEVSADDGRTWLPAQLEREAGRLSWRRWLLRLSLAPGLHPLTVRAIDGSGAVQDAQRRSPHPSGASGYHRVNVTVVP